MAPAENPVFLEALVNGAELLRKKGLVCVEVVAVPIKGFFAGDEAVTVPAIRGVKPEHFDTERSSRPVTYVFVDGQATNEEGGTAEYNVVEVFSTDDLIDVQAHRVEKCHIAWDWTWGAMV